MAQHRAKVKRWLNKEHIEVGCDEAGRGCLAGPVYAAAVILPKTFRHPLLNDSKQVNAEDREKLRTFIEKKAIAWAVASCDNEEIDQINILNASFLAMHRAVDQLKVKFDSLLIDGNRFNKYKEVAHTCIVDGDALYMSIAAASILAKTYRDDHMRKLHLEHSEYGWDSNKGYGTPFHREVIERIGVTRYHRKTFGAVADHYALELESEGELY